MAGEAESGAVTHTGPIEDGAAVSPSLLPPLLLLLPPAATAAAPVGSWAGLGAPGPPIGAPADVYNAFIGRDGHTRSKTILE